MNSIDIKASFRTETGKKSSRKLRKENNVPCVMYGGEEILHFYSHENNFKSLIYTPNVYVVNFDIDGKKVKAVLKDIQFQPVTDKITHIDFIQVADERPVILDIPIKVVGDSIGIKAGGKVRMKRRTIKIKGLVKDMPDSLEIDITDLEIGMSIKIHELSYENLEILDPARAMVVAVQSSRMALKDAALPEDETEEGEEEAKETEEGEEGGETPASEE
jgi:large subunit ribosomal protein L25